MYSRVRYVYATGTLVYLGHKRTLPAFYAGSRLPQPRHAMFKLYARR